MADIERCAQALKDRYGRLGILSRVPIRRHPTLGEIAQTVLDAAAEDEADMVPGALAQRFKDERNIAREDLRSFAQAVLDLPCVRSRRRPVGRPATTRL